MGFYNFDKEGKPPEKEVKDLKADGEDGQDDFFKV